MDSRILVMAAVLALGVSEAQSAEPVYKSTMPDGRIVYGESPQPGAKRVAKVAAPPENAGVVVATPEDKARASALNPPGKAAITVIPQPVRPPTQPPVAGQSSNPSNALPGTGNY